MRSHLTWLLTGLLGLTILTASPVGAEDDSGLTSVTTTPAATPAPTSADPLPVDGDPAPGELPELAPGESPGGLSDQGGPMLTLLVEAPETTDVEPAGPVIFDSLGPAGVSDNTVKSVLLLLIVTAVPSLTLGAALWSHRDRAVVNRSKS